MSCPNCGRHQDLGDQFCGGCGSPVTDSRRLWPFIVGAVIALGFVGLGWYLLPLPDGSPAGDPATSETNLAARAGSASLPDGWDTPILGEPGAVPLVVDGVPIEVVDGMELGPMFDIETDEALEGQITLVFPVELASPPPAGLPVGGVLRYDESTQGWESVASEYDADLGGLVVTVDHLSWYNPYTWDWGSILSELSAGIGRAVGVRTDEPACETALPIWVRDVVYVDDPTNPVLVCAESDVQNADLVAVRISNNRPYWIEVSPLQASFAWTWVAPASGPVELVLADTFTDLLKPGSYLLPPLTESAVGVAQGQPIFDIDTQPTPVTLAVELIVLAFEQANVNDAELMRAVVDCVAVAAWTLGDFGVDLDLVGQAFQTVGGCVSNAEVLTELARNVSISRLEKLSAIGRAYDAWDVLQLGTDLLVDELLLDPIFVTVFSRPARAPIVGVLDAWVDDHDYLHVTTSDETELIAGPLDGPNGPGTAFLIGGRDFDGDGQIEVLVGTPAGAGNLFMDIWSVGLNELHFVGTIPYGGRIFWDSGSECFEDATGIFQIRSWSVYLDEDWEFYQEFQTVIDGELVTARSEQFQVAPSATPIDDLETATHRDFRVNDCEPTRLFP